MAVLSNGIYTFHMYPVCKLLRRICYSFRVRQHTLTVFSITVTGNRRQLKRQKYKQSCCAKPVKITDKDSSLYVRHNCQNYILCFSKKKTTTEIFPLPCLWVIIEDYDFFVSCNNRFYCLYIEYPSIACMFISINKRLTVVLACLSLR